MPRPKDAQEGLRDPIRFNRKSGWALLAFGSVILVLLWARPDLASAEWNEIFGRPGWRERMDWLLLGIFFFFMVCSALDPKLNLDSATVCAGLFGGAVIEFWGTRSGAWYYYTGEAPPLWILPAWGASALANEKLQRLGLALVPEKFRERVIAEKKSGTGITALYLVVMVFLVSFMLWWAKPVINQVSTIAVSALIVLALWRPRYPLYALSLFLFGSLLGIFLEIWGTTRHCWNYYDGKTPSPFPIFGHGIAAIAFWRLKESVRSVFSRARSLFKKSIFSSGSGC